VAPPDSETQALYNQYEKSYRQAMAVLILGDLVRVAGGDFLYGDNKQRHNVPAFDIGKYPVTVEQYLAFVKATKHAADNYWNGDLSGNLKHPAVYVNVSDAEAYCRWASQITGRAVRLPSEQEWEKAARGTDGRDYPWGNVAPDHTYACFNMSATTPVGSYPKGASPYGCMDMAGNVWEWCQGGVIRGGAYNHYGNSLRCAFRLNDYPASRNPNVGFRILASPIS
jgi:serine/threonine-protein kinase